MHAWRNSKPNSRRSRWMLTASTALTASLLLAGCGSFQKPPLREPVTRELPDPPPYLQPAEVPPAREGVSPFVVSEQRKAVIQQQNYVIVRTREAWHTMKRTYSTSKGLIKRSLFGQR